MLRRIGIALVALIAAIAGSTAAARGAQARAITCPDGFICFFNGSDGSGSIYVRLVSEIPRSRCIVLPTSATNRTSYIWNRSGSTFSVFDGGSCQTVPGTIYAQSSGRMRGVWDNSITSFFRH